MSVFRPHLFMFYKKEYLEKKLVFSFYPMNVTFYEDYLRKVKANAYTSSYNINIKLLHLLVNCFLLI